MLSVNGEEMNEDKTGEAEEWRKEWSSLRGQH